MADVKENLNEETEALKISDIIVTPKWIYDANQDSITVAAKINNVDMCFRFRPFFEYLVKGVDCNDAYLTALDRNRWGEYNIPGDAKKVTISDGGGYRMYALKIPESVLKSQPKQNQKDFRFTGQYYSTNPIKDYFKKAMQELYAKGELTDAFLKAANLTNMPLEEKKKDEWEVKLIFKGGRTKIGLITDNSEEAAKFAKDQYKNNKEVKDFKVFHNGEETPFNGDYYDNNGYYNDSIGDLSHLGEEVLATYWQVREYWLTMGGDRSDYKDYNFKSKERAEEFKKELEAKQAASGKKGMDAHWFEGPKEIKVDINFNESLDEAVEIHDKLNPKIWTEDKELRPEVRAKVLQIVDKFKSQLLVDNVDLKVEDIYILGSNANYNYTEESDLDVHIIADESFDCSAEHLPLLYNCYKALFNSKYDIRIRGINVELYVENKDALSNVSAGIYSLKDGWIRNPSEYEIPEFDQVAVDKEVQKWEDKYYELTENPTVKKIDEYIDGLYDLRKDSIKNGEFAEGNLVFKEIRRRGYLDDLKELKIELTSQELSLESLDEAYKMRFHYRGPVYHFNFCIAEDWEEYTEAVSEKQALNNLTVKAKKYFGYILQTRITLNPDYLECVEPDEDANLGKEIKHCEKCGATLTDAGECPSCDLGDHTALEEDIKSSCYDSYVDWAKNFEDDEDKQAYIDDVKNNKVLSEKEREELLKLTESVKLNEDLIVIEPNEGKEKLSNLKDLIERTTDPQTKDALLTLMNIYLFQTYKPSDREGSTLTDSDWEGFSQFYKDQQELKNDESFEDRNNPTWDPNLTEEQKQHLKELLETLED